MSSLDATDELARCDQEQSAVVATGPDWVWALVWWADWEIERELIVKGAAANLQAGLLQARRCGAPDPNRTSVF
jgi:hypothetical protein